MEQKESNQSGSEKSVGRGSESWQSENRQSEIYAPKSRHLKTRQSENEIIAAIDFGTTYTGFAYVFNGNTDQIFTGKHGYFLKDDRVPTVLLLKPNGDFHSFGVDAEDNYAILALRVKHHENRLFRNFKMALYTQNDSNLNNDLTINDTEDRPKRAIDIFSIIIEHLKNLILDSMIQSTAGDRLIFESKTQWILTIPAISSDSARQFMREAAVKGGIPEKNLRLVLEPEAASLFCKSELLEMTHDAELTKLPPGMKYILADLGGGTADICSHEILEDGKIRELNSAQGGNYGGASVNNGFIQFLIKLFGADIIKRFKTNRMIDYLRVMREFEEKKQKFDYQHTVEQCIDIPQALVGMVEKDTGCTLKQLVANTSFSKRVTVIDNILLCDEEIIESFFKFSVEGILQTIISQSKKDEINILLLVGGYAESRYIRGIIQKEFDQMNVVLVQEPRLAVLKGAVYMGFEPRNIIERRARYTYGFAIARPFLEGTHPESLKFTREGRVLCNKIFSKLIGKNQILTYNQEFSKSTSNTLTQPDSKRLVLSVSLYRTDKSEPEYCLETEGCLQIGKIVMKPPVDGWPDCVDIDSILIVSETEFTVKAIDKSSGREYKTYVDFLS